MTLPISVILPTRNAMSSIERHLQEIQEWLPHVGQVIVVDSSEDGTLNYLRAKLSESNVSFFSRPRGLYESWNFAVQQAKAEFVYFSTIGDTINLEGLRRLLDGIQSASADIIVSPPEMFNDRGELIQKRWPIHSLCENLQCGEVRLLSFAEALQLTISCVPETVLGSSASNLYRRAFIAMHPFPEGWGHCADSAWIISHSLRARIAVLAQTVARFVIHPKERAPDAPPALESHHFQDMFHRANEALDQSNLPSAEVIFLRGWLSSLHRRYQQFFDVLDSHVIYFTRFKERIRVQTERGDTFKVRIATLEEEIDQLRRKVIDLRRDMGIYERIHRSLPRMVVLYFSVKWQQIHKALTLLNRKLRRIDA